MNRDDAFKIVNGAFNEHAAARISIRRMLTESIRDPILLRENALAHSDLCHCGDNLEITYLTRLFAEFEGILRDFYWSAVHPRRNPRQTKTETLLDRIAARQYVPHDVLRGAHEVRHYRNAIIHDRLRIPRLSLHECKSRLARYLHHLPVHW